MTTTQAPPVPVLEDHGTWGRLGPFSWDIWEDGPQRLYAAFHDLLSSPLGFFREPGECRSYIGSGQAQTEYEAKRTEGEKP